MSFNPASTLLLGFWELSGCTCCFLQLLNRSWANLVHLTSRFLHEMSQFFFKDMVQHLLGCERVLANNCSIRAHTHATSFPQVSKNNLFHYAGVISRSSEGLL